MSAPDKPKSGYGDAVAASVGAREAANDNEAMSDLVSVSCRIHEGPYCEGCLAAVSDFDALATHQRACPQMRDVIIEEKLAKHRAERGDVCEGGCDVGFGPCGGFHA